MRHATAIFCAIAATAAAVTNPLGNEPANYTFTVPAFTNLLQGRLSGPSGDYRAMRIEDMDYLAEAAAERNAVKSHNLQGVTNRAAVIVPQLSLYPDTGGGSCLGAVDNEIKSIGSSSTTRTAYADEVPSFSLPVVSAVPLTCDEILAAADNSVHVLTQADMTLTRRKFPALADLRSRYEVLDAIPCAVSRDGGYVYTSNAIANHYHAEYYTNGVVEEIVDSSVSWFPSGEAAQYATWDWTRPDTESAWALASSETESSIVLATNLDATAFSVPGSFYGLAFALTSQPVRVANAQAVVEWELRRSDVTQTARVYADLIYSNTVESATYETNYVYAAYPATVSLWRPGHVGMAAVITETNILDACGWKYPALSDASISPTPIPPGGYGEDARFDTFERWRVVGLNMTPKVRFFVFETKFKTTIGGN